MKNKNPIIVFTNGCFDILHIGHIRLLQKAKAEGDILIVGLNSDTSVRMIKGKNRPIIPEEQRAEMLKALECVDHVVIFPEISPLRLISRLRPDVLVKGEDWKERDIIGRELVKRIVRIPLEECMSTTDIIEKIREEI
jgi:rfaE bifunctional protein nucleotidyltransferase chain/domain